MGAAAGMGLAEGTGRGSASDGGVLWTGTALGLGAGFSEGS